MIHTEKSPVLPEPEPTPTPVDEATTRELALTFHINRHTSIFLLIFFQLQLKNRVSKFKYQNLNHPRNQWKPRSMVCDDDFEFYFRLICKNMNPKLIHLVAVCGKELWMKICFFLIYMYRGDCSWNHWAQTRRA